jgi:hypothetical protein
MLRKMDNKELWGEGGPMEYSQIQLFMRFADSNPDLWRNLTGCEVVHATHGRGKIVRVRTGAERKFYVDIVYESNDAKLIPTTPESLCNAKFFPVVAVPESLKTPLIAMKDELERMEEQARLEEELRQERLRQESQLVGLPRDVSVDEGIQSVIDQFLSLLEKCLRSRGCTSEADVRDVFRDALIANQVPYSNIRYEEPHRHLGGSSGRIDVLVLESSGLGRSAIEFKYDREIDSGHNQPRTQKAGALYADLSRLLRWPNQDWRYFIYLTDDEMYYYLSGGGDVFGRTFRPSSGYHVDLDSNSFDDKPDAFHGKMRTWPCKATLWNLAFKRFESGLPRHHLWIFQVLNRE